MRIAFIAPFGVQPKGTVSARMLPLAHALAARGHSIRVVVPPWDDPAARDLRRSSHQITQAGDSAGVHVVTLPLPRRAPYTVALTAGLVREALRPSSVGLPATLSSEARSLATFRPQVVHVFKPVGYSGLSALAIQAARVPWVLDVDDWEGPGGWADVNPYSLPQKLAVTLQDALLPRLAGAVTTASRTLESRCWGFGVPRRRVLYMPNGVWRDRYGDWAERSRGEDVQRLRAKYGLEGSPVLLLYTRFAEFPWQWPLEILARVRASIPGVRLLVVGNGFFGEEDLLREEASSRGMGDSVVVLGRVAERDLPAHLGLGDVALYPMRDSLLNRAKSPVKVLEPMVAGLPMVAHRVGQAAEFIADTGVLVEPGNLEAMASAAASLLGDPARRAALGEAARQRVWSCFNWEGLSAAAEQAYRVSGA